jgi:predicted nucleic acid-binding protein
MKSFQMAHVAVPGLLPAPVSIDPDDDAVLACAVAAKADAIVSGDRHLLSLGSYDGIPIMTAADLLAQLAQP